MTEPKDLELEIARMQGRIMYLEDMLGRVIATLPDSEKISDYEPDFIRTLTKEAGSAKVLQRHRESAVLMAIAGGAKEGMHELGDAIGTGYQQL